MYTHVADWMISVLPFSVKIHSEFWLQVIKPITFLVCLMGPVIPRLKLCRPCHCNWFYCYYLAFIQLILPWYTRLPQSKCPSPQDSNTVMLQICIHHHSSRTIRLFFPPINQESHFFSRLFRRNCNFCMLQGKRKCCRIIV